MKKSFLLPYALLLFLCSCMSVQSKYVNGITITREFKTSKTKENAFTDTLEHIAMSFRSANDVIQFKDKERGKIIVKGNVTCNIYAGFMGGSGLDSHIEFALVTELSNNSAKVTIQNAKATQHNIPRNDKEAEMVQKCLEEEILDGFTQVLN